MTRNPSTNSNPLADTTLLRLSIGLVYVYFGSLKFFPGSSPAEQIAGDTIAALSYQVIEPALSMPLLAGSELFFGLALMLGMAKPYVYRLCALHMFFTFSPMLLFPERTFGDGALEFTLLGQYIFKNIVILSVLTVLIRAEARSKQDEPSFGYGTKTWSARMKGMLSSWERGWA